MSETRETLQSTEHASPRKMVAKLVPPTPGPVVSPDFVGRAREVWGKKPRGKPLGELVDQDRQ